MKNRVKNTTKKLSLFMERKQWLPVLLAGALGATLCIYLYGFSILNPTNTRWLYGNGDISQHQIGWDFFRTDGWRLPLGAMQNLAFPEGTSLVYMDSIPLAAIFFKLFNTFLPNHFQYFGIWGLLCFMLQGMFAAAILRKFTSSQALTIIGSVFIALLPIFLMRTYAHTALGSQWLLLVGLALIVYRHHFVTTRKSVAVWSLLMAISVAVHPYFVPMNAILLLIYLVLSSKSLMSTVTHIAGAAMSFLGSFWLIGGFVTKDVGTATLGMFGADLNALINPIAFSYFLKPFPTTTGAYEGLGYLGLGVYLMIFFVLATYLMRIRLISVNKKSTLKFFSIHKKVLFAAVIVLLSLVLAVGPVVYMNGNLLGVVVLPDLIARALSIFRSTGRFVWIAAYVMSFAALILYLSLHRKNRNGAGVGAVLVLLLVVQFIDVTKSSGMKDKITNVRTASTRYSNRFDNEQVRQMLNGKKHVAYTANSLHADNFFELGAVVASEGMTINDGYISREPVASVNRETMRSRNELIRDDLDQDTVYVTNDPTELDGIRDNNATTVRQIDDVWLVTRKD